jgi:hypothetical protein
MCFFTMEGASAGLGRRAFEAESWACREVSCVVRVAMERVRRRDAGDMEGVGWVGVGVGAGCVGGFEAEGCARG